MIGARDRKHAEPSAGFAAVATWSRARAGRLWTALRIIAVGLAITCLCPVNDTHAQAPNQEPTAEMLRLRAEEIIASAAGEPGLLLPESHPPAVAVRHTRSGLLCRFAYSGEDRLFIFGAGGISYGDNIACSINAQFGAITLYATRDNEATMESALAGAVQALLAVHPNAQPLELSTLPTATNPSAPPPPEFLSAAFSIQHHGRRIFTRVSVYVANGWVYKLRFTSDTPRSNWAGDLLWVVALDDLRNYPNAQPVQ